MFSEHHWSWYWEKNRESEVPHIYIYLLSKSALMPLSTSPGTGPSGLFPYNVMTCQGRVPRGTQKSSGWAVINTLPTLICDRLGSWIHESHSDHSWSMKSEFFLQKLGSHIISIQWIRANPIFVWGGATPRRFPPWCFHETPPLSEVNRRWVPKAWHLQNMTRLWTKFWTERGGPPVSPGWLSYDELMLDCPAMEIYKNRS